MGCITSTSFVVLINGEATKFFQSKCGLRQGCPLSPFLFILVMEGLSIMLKKGQVEGTLTGIKVSRLIKILHFLFVDDVIIMTNSKMYEWTEINKIINILCKVSGMRVNIQKIEFSALRHTARDYRRATIFIHN
jgi:mannosylglycoprotein endo-beta-mannosidase